jgi:hypothetical protein
MRRPPLHVVTAMLLLAATVVTAVPAGAQERSRVLRRAFDPSVTPLFGIATFGARTVDLQSERAFEFANSVAFGVQLDRPLTRRTALMGTATLAPFTRVAGVVGGSVAELEKALVAGMDVGIAARLKPAAPLFAYLGGGGVLSTRRAAAETDGTGFDPRASAGLGIDVMRFERTGFRFMYIAHLVFPGTPDATRWEAKSSVFDRTIVVGGRYTLGSGRDEP